MEQNVFKNSKIYALKITVFIDIIYQENNSLYRQWGHSYYNPKARKNKKWKENYMSVLYEYRCKNSDDTKKLNKMANLQHHIPWLLQFGYVMFF